MIFPKGLAIFCYAMGHTGTIPLVPTFLGHVEHHTVRHSCMSCIPVNTSDLVTVALNFYEFSRQRRKNNHNANIGKLSSRPS